MLKNTMLAVAICTGAAAVAQTSPYWRPLELSPLLPQDQTVKATVAGNFTGHNMPDLAYLLGGQVVLCTAPAVHNAITPITAAIGATGLAMMPRGSYGRDGLAIATSTGLWQWTVDSTSLLAIESGVAWRLVACADLDGLPPHDLIGACGNDTMRVLLRNGTSTTVLTRVFTGETIAHVLPVQWDGAGPPEIAVATNARLWIGSQTTTATEFVAANDECHVARVCMASRDNVAWWRRAGSQSTLDVVSALGRSQCDTTSLGTILHLTAGGDNDPNDAPDLLVSLVATSSLRRLVNTALPTANVATFDPNQTVVDSPFDEQSGGPAFGAAWYGDLNGDDDADTFAPALWTTPASSAVCVRIEPTNSRRPRIGDAEISQTGDQRTFTFQTSVFAGMALPEGATHLELLPFAARVRTGTLATMTQGLPRVRVAPTATSIAFTVTVDEVTPPAFVGIVRWIKLGPDNLIERAWPPTKFALATNNAVPPYGTWRATRMSQVAPPPEYVWSSEIPVSSPVYLLRPLQFIGDTVVTMASTTGDEEPPDLPPPPPVPPKPPTPPGDGTGGG